MVLEAAGCCWRLLDAAEGYWRPLEAAEGCWRLLETAKTLSYLLRKEIIFFVINDAPMYCIDKLN
jgi:hypothetical protein